jgi:hypothetical protein
MMSQDLPKPDLKAALDAAFSGEVATIFTDMVSNLSGQKQVPKAEDPIVIDAITRAHRGLALAEMVYASLIVGAVR